MSQNTSPAVMQQRHEALDSLDDFPTPPWATRALFEIVLPEVPRGRRVVDPGCNRGHMVRPLVEIFDEVVATDVHDYRGDPLPAKVAGRYFGQRCGFEREHDFRQAGLCDFTLPGEFESAFPRAFPVDWVVMNPPFNLAEEFIERALAMAQIGVAVFQRTSFLEGQGRYERLFADRPETIFAPFTERVILHKGVLRDPRKEYLDDQGRWKKPSTATSYGWFVWLKDEAPRPIHRIRRCRLELERPGDYPNNPDERAAQPEAEGTLL